VHASGRASVSLGIPSISFYPSNPFHPFNSFKCTNGPASLCWRGFVAAMVCTLPQSHCTAGLGHSVSFGVPARVSAPHLKS